MSRAPSKKRVSTKSANPRKGPPLTASNPRGGRPTAERAKLRAAYLQSIAVEVFTEFGYERASLDEIARRAGTSKETLYSQHASKSELFLASINKHLDNFFKPFNFLVTDEPRSLKENLRELGFQVITAILVDEAQHVTHTIYAESFRFPELGRRLWQLGHERAYSDLAQYLRKEIGKAHLREVDAVLMARQFLELIAADVIWKMMLNVQRSMTATQKRTHVDAAVETFLRAFGA